MIIDYLTLPSRRKGAHSTDLAQGPAVRYVVL
jgi:hypothetical protein